MYDTLGKDLDPTTQEGAKAMLSSRGGKKAGQIAIAELWKATRIYNAGYLPTARISAPLRVLLALETLGLIERANDNRGRAIRFRLTPSAALMAAKKDWSR